MSIPRTSNSNTDKCDRNRNIVRNLDYWHYLRHVGRKILDIKFMTRLLLAILLAGFLSIGACQCSEKPEPPPVAALP